MFCIYVQDDTESSGVRNNDCIGFSMESVDFAQSINLFEKVSYDLNTLFKFHLSHYQHVRVSSCSQVKVDVSVICDE